MCFESAAQVESLASWSPISWKELVDCIRCPQNCPPLPSPQDVHKLVIELLQITLCGIRNPRKHRIGEILLTWQADTHSHLTEWSQAYCGYLALDKWLCGCVYPLWIIKDGVIWKTKSQLFINASLQNGLSNWMLYSMFCKNTKSLATSFLKSCLVNYFFSLGRITHAVTMVQSLCICFSTIVWIISPNINLRRYQHVKMP